jgi:hypothetical protein
MKAPSPEKQLAGFMARYTPEIQALAQEVLARMRARLPGAIELVYDNYNALVIGFGPSERASEAIFSIILYPRWVTLYFLHGASLADPHQLLKGSGKVGRHLVLEDARALDRPGVRTLMAEAIESAPRPLDSSNERWMVIKSVSARQRPRRPKS